MAGTSGLGYSTPQAIDRDGDGYGLGPTALVNTTIASAISSGVQTVTPASMSNISSGAYVRIEHGPNQECGTVTSTTGTTFTMTFQHAHPAGVSVLDLGIIGPDADDLDSSVHTGPQGVTRYSSLAGLIFHLEGFTPTHIWYLAPASPTAGCLANGGTNAQCTGNDANSCEDNVNAPCLTGPHVVGSVTAGMAIVFRDGWNGVINILSGTSGNPIILMAYPGELPVIDLNTFGGASINTQGQSWLIVDTFQTQNGACMRGGDNNYAENPHTFHDNVFKHIVGTNCIQGFGPTAGFLNLTIRDSIFHDNDGPSEQAGIYVGGSCVPSLNLTIQNVISYKNGFSGIHLNGWVNNANISQNLVYNNLLEGIVFESGVNTSTVSSNVVFISNGAEFQIYNYQNGLGMVTGCDANFYPATNATWAAGTATVTIPPGVLSGTYTSGGSITGTTGQTCVLQNFTAGGGSGTLAVVALTGTNTIAGGSALVININGSGYTSAPTSATLSNGSATCSGTATVSTVVANNIATGQFAYINGFNPSGFNCTGTGANTGTGCLLTAHTSTTVSYAVASNPGAYVSGGYVTGDVGDQANNLIENNTFYHGNLDFQGNATGNQSAIWTTSHCSAQGCGGIPVVGDLGHNTFRNNIAVNYGDVSSSIRYAPIAFDNSNLNFMGFSTGAGFLGSDVFDHNLTFQSNGVDSTTAAYGLIGQTCSPTCNGEAVYDLAGNVLNGGPALSSIATGFTITGGLDGNPQFLNASPTFNATFGKFDLRLANNSPGFQSGSTTKIPNYDLAGRVFTDGTPSMGGLERNLYASGWTLISGARLMDAADGGASANCPADGANSSTGWQSNASTPVPFNFNCHNIIDAWGGGWMRDAPGKPPRLCIFGGGHSDGGDNSVYCVNVAAAGPTMTRILGPSTYGGGSLNDWNNCPAGLPDSAPTTAPNSRHSGSSFAYMASLDKTLMQHGALACGNSRNAYDTWTYDNSAVSWTANNPVDCTNHGFGTCPTGTPPITPVANTAYDPETFNISCGGFNDNNVWDPVTSTAFDLFNCDSFTSTLAQYFPANNQWVVREAIGNPGPGTNSQANGVLIPETRIMWVLGNAKPAGTGTGGRALQYNLTNLSSVTGTDYSTTCAADPVCNTVISNANATPTGQAPGLEYRSIEHQIYSWNTGNGGTYYTLNPETLVGATHALSGGPPTTGNALGGTYGRFRYSPGLDVFALIPGYNQSTAILSINAADPSVGCVITPATLGQWTNTQVISQTLTESGCVASNFSMAGAWPTGLSGCTSGAGPTCTVSGTINEPSGGTSTPSVSYSTATNNYSITVNPVPSITTSCPLPNANQGSAYSDSLSETGGTLPFTWTISAGSLPTGLSLSSGGLISGTPTGFGSSSFTIKLADANNISTTQACSMFVIQTIPQLGTAGARVFGGQTR